jgi:hypothetical protein
MVAGLVATTQILWRRLQSRFGILAPVQPGYEAGVSRQVVPTVDATEVLEDRYVEVTTMDLTGSGFVAIATAPEGFRLQLYAIFKNTSTGLCAGAIGDATDYVQVQTPQAAAVASGFGGGIPTPARGRIGFVGGGNAGDGAIGVRVCYGLVPCQESDKQPGP